MLSSIDIPKMRPIVLLTPQHAGTHFWEYVFFKHPQIYSTKMRLEGIEPPGRYLKQIRADYKTLSKVKNQRPIIHSHLISMGHLWLLLMVFPTFMGLRDPLLTLITVENRRPGAAKSPHVFDMMDRWVEVVKTFNELGMPDFVVGIDLLSKKSDKEKTQVITDIFSKFELSENRNVVDEIVSEWPMKRSFGNSHIQLKTAYQQGDARYIRENLSPGLWKKLKEIEPTVRPFLQTHGYQNLLWW